MKKHKIRSKIISSVSIITILSMNSIGVAEASRWWNNNIQLNNGGDVYISNNLNKDLNGGSGDDIITISNNLNGDIDGGSGNDTITIPGNSIDIDGGSGNDIITISGNSNGYIDGGSNNDTITVAGNTNKIYGGSGNDILTISGHANGSIDLGSGNDNVKITGNSNQIEGDSGNDNITISGHANGSIDLGSGNDNIVIYGNSSKIKGGSGKDIILVKGTANQNIEGGSGDDIICISNLNSKIEGDSGYDTVYVKEGLDNWKYNKIDAESINKVSDINNIDACTNSMLEEAYDDDDNENDCVYGYTNDFYFETFNHNETQTISKEVSTEGGTQTLETTIKCNNGNIVTTVAAHPINIICSTGIPILSTFLCESNTQDCVESTKNGFTFPFFNHQAEVFAEKIESILNGSKITKVTSTCDNSTVTLGTDEIITYSCDAGFNDDDNNGTCEENNSGNYIEINKDNSKGEMLVAGGCYNFLEGKKNITFSTDIKFDGSYDFDDTVPLVNYLHSDGSNDNSFRIEIHPSGSNKFYFGVDKGNDGESSDTFNNSLLFDGEEHNITISIENRYIKYYIDNSLLDNDYFESYDDQIPGNGLLIFGQEQDRRGGYFDMNNEYISGKIYSMKFFTSSDTNSNPLVEWNMDNFSYNKATSTNGNYTLIKTSISNNSDNISPTAYQSCMDSEPDNINIEDYSDLDIDETIITPKITLEGINVPINVSISDGEIILNGNNKGSSTTAEEFDDIQFEITADEDKTVTVNIGDLTENISIGTKEEVVETITLCHNNNDVYIPTYININSIGDYADNHYDYISEDDSCSCVKENSTTNLVSNGSFETFSLINRVKTWYNYLFGFVSKFDNLTAWDSQTVNFELWKNDNNFKASNGDTFIELDVDSNSQDKISQNITTKAGKKYVLSFDLRGRQGYSNGVIVKYNNQVVITANGGDEWINHEVIINGIEGSASLSFEEPSTDDDSYGTWLDNISVNEIVKSCPTDESDGSGLTPGIDSDNDGIDDTIETGTDTDGDGIPNYLDTDSDGDGILDSIEGTGDDDGDDIMNFIDGDNDTDLDGIPDIVDGTEDTDGDGTLNYNDLDSDDDGITDEEEGSTDNDNDGIPNFKDSDSDDDGITDEEEGSTDNDNDGIPNYLDSDSDDDGIPDLIEGIADNDNDGIPNYLDSDSDDDGIPDLIEGVADNDNDGIPNYLDSDSDGDGIPDLNEIAIDSDGDGIPDYLDSDSDGDGIPDYIEITEDPDEDGIPNYLDLDSDGDGIFDEIETNIDTDGDGIPDYIDTDSDNDGISDEIESNLDSDGDGIPDYQDTDSDNDGISDSNEGGNTDTDGDGIPDYKDSDSDGSEDSNTEDIDGTDEETISESTPEQKIESSNFVKENLKECRVDGNKLILQFSHTYNVIK